MGGFFGTLFWNYLRLFFLKFKVLNARWMSTFLVQVCHKKGLIRQKGTFYIEPSCL